MAHEVAILAVNWHEVARSRQLEHGFQFLLAGMTRDMNFRDLFVVNLCAASIEVVDQIGDGFLVSGNEF